MGDLIEWDSLAKVVVAGVIAGAGFPALFAVGVRLLSERGSRDEEGYRPPWRVVIAVVCFAVVVAGAAAGVILIARH